MKNAIKLIGIIALAAVIGFSMTACGEEEDIVRFDKALYGTWESYHLSSRLALEFITSTEKDAIVFYYESVGSDDRLIAKNGNTYTLYNAGHKDLVFTAEIGSDGKLTISGLTDNVYVNTAVYNRTYTKKAD